MKPRIVAITGPLKGNVFEITEAGLTLGRDEANEVCLEDDLVSRKHSGIRVWEDGDVVVEDLGSKNGTFVNAVMVSRKVSSMGTPSRWAAHPFIYKDGREDEETIPVFGDSEHDKNRTITTLRVDRSSGTYPNTDQLQNSLLELIFEVIPAKRAALYLVRRGVVNLRFGGLTVY